MTTRAMTTVETWRVVDDRGEAHEVTISPARWPGQWYVTATGRLRTVAASTARSAAATVAAMHFAVAEIRGPSEKTTAEQLAAVTAERDRLVARVAELEALAAGPRVLHIDGDLAAQYEPEALTWPVDGDGREAS